MEHIAYFIGHTDCHDRIAARLKKAGIYIHPFSS